MTNENETPEGEKPEKAKPEKAKPKKVKSKKAKPEDVTAKFRKLYEEFAKSKDCYGMALKGIAGSNPDCYHSILNAIRQKPFGADIDIAQDFSRRVLSNLELSTCANTWYTDSRNNVFEFADKNLEGIVKGIDAEKLSKAIETTLPPKTCSAPYKALKEAHKTYFDSKTILEAYAKSEDPGEKMEAGAKMREEAPKVIEREYKKLDIDNAELWAELFSTLAQYSTQYAASIYVAEMEFSRKRFAEELGKVGSKGATEYFTEIAKNDDNKERLYDTLYKMTNKDKKNGKSKKK